MVNEACGNMVVGEVPEVIMTGGRDEEDDISSEVDASAIVVLGRGQVDLLTCEQISGLVSIYCLKIVSMVSILDKPV